MLDHCAVLQRAQIQSETFVDLLDQECGVFSCTTVGLLHEVDPNFLQKVLNIPILWGSLGRKIRNVCKF